MAGKRKIEDFLNLLYNAAYIPVHYFRKDELIMAFPANELPVDFISAYKGLLTESNENVSFRSTEDFLFLGIIQNFNTGETIIVGPVSNVTITSDIIDHMIKEYSLPVVKCKQIHAF